MLAVVETFEIVSPGGVGMSSNGLADSKVESFEDKILCQAGQVDFKLDHFNRSILSFESLATTTKFRLILLQLLSRYDTINALGIQQAATPFKTHLKVETSCPVDSSSSVSSRIILVAP